MADDCSRLRGKWLSRRAALVVALIGLSFSGHAVAADEKPAPAAAAASPLSERFEQLSKTIGSIDASGVPCKLGDQAVGCAEAAKAASVDLKQVRKQLTREIRQLRKAKAKEKLARALEFGSSLNRLKTGLRKLGAADNAEAAQDALSQLNEQLGKAKAQLQQLNADAS
ncbi:MAG: hypothetical protein H6718_07230 [Polyangiaceae bacterium]|nr:hypothetical protein [Myxococcales bacterium]MCB9585173.1 hypothetical protein [Polyangiaceae bacterium]